jgi:hypothetical protein
MARNGYTFLEISQTAVVMYRWLSMASAGRWITCATSPAPMMPTRSLLSAMFCVGGGVCLAQSKCLLEIL